MAQKKRLAEMLVEEGVITEIQLQNALQRQLIMGGKIGTNLIDLKYVTEEMLGKTLSKIYKMPYIPAGGFLHIPQEIIKSIPKEIAIRHRVIPIKKDPKNITIAMENPNNLSALDEISFMTGCRITPVVASEVRIALELERYYDHPRDVRYIRIQRPNEEFVMERDLPVAEIVQEETKKSAVAVSSHEWLGGEDEADYYMAQPIGIGAPMEHPSAMSFKDVVTVLSKAETRDEAIKLVLEYTAQYMENVIFFVASVAEAKIWNSRCKGIKGDALHNLKVSFGGPSVFLTVKNNEQPYYGEISAFPFDNDFLEAIGRSRPARVLLVPVMVKTRVVAILYCDNGGKEIGQDRIAEISSLIEKLSLVFEILILKKKTESTK